MYLGYKAIIKLFVAIVLCGVTFVGCGNGITWQEAREKNTYEAYQTYIETHPEGKHIKKARKLAEGLYWNKIKEKKEAAVFKKYLDQFPNGKHKLEVQTKLNQLLSGGGHATKARVTGSSVIIRSSHTTDSPSVGVVAREGTIVQILDLFNTGSNNGAILKKGITVVDHGKQYDLSQGKALQILTDLKDSVQVSFATTNDASVEVIISKEVIESMSGQMWYKIHTKDDITGWIYGEFIEEL